MDRRDFLRTSGLAAAGLALRGGPRPAEAAHSPKAPVRPHIILLMTDQHRGDALGCAGHPSVRTPNIDSIAASGVRFVNGFSSTPSCTPARAGLLTGLSPWHHGMLGYGRVARRYKYEMPRMLSELGYYGFGIGKMHWFPQKSLHGFDGTLVDESGRVEQEGFVSDYRDWFKLEAPGQNPDATGIGWNEHRAGVYTLDERLHPTAGLNMFGSIRTAGSSSSTWRRTPAKRATGRATRRIETSSKSSAAAWPTTSPSGARASRRTAGLRSGKTASFTAPIIRRTNRRAKRP